MSVTLKDIIELAKEIPENYYEEVYANFTEIMKKNARHLNKTMPKAKVCPHCKSSRTVRNGKRHSRQAYICRDCEKTFVETTGSAIANSHSSTTVWRKVIKDTVNGISLDKTAEELDLHHETVFNMRHKILFLVEQELLSSPVGLDGVCEADETYVLENEKGRKFPDTHHREPRKRGGKASKRGLSNEQICICASVNGNNKCIAMTVNRAAPSKDELEQVFSNRINEDTVILCDGSKNYDIFEDKCTVAHVKYPNRENGFHSFIKERLRVARGVATIYQNRYNALFASVFGSLETTVDKIYDLVISSNDSYSSNSDIKTKNLLTI